MEDLLLLLLSALAELLSEVFFQVVVEEVVALALRLLRNASRETRAIDPTVAALGYLLAGSTFGIVSLLPFPRPLFRASRFHGISLMISPVITGLLMSQIGLMLHRTGKRAVQIESFKYGFTFALGVAVVRFMFTR